MPKPVESTQATVEMFVLFAEALGEDLAHRIFEVSLFSSRFRSSRGGRSHGEEVFHMENRMLNE